MKFGNMIKVLCVCGCIQGSCWGMNRTKSEPSLFTGMDIQTEIVKSNSAPVTTREIQKVISKWSHLVPDGVIKDKIDCLIQSLESSEEKEKLVDLLCSSFDERYALYASVVFADAFTEENEEVYKFGRMLAHISNDRVPGLSSFYWKCYADGYYD